MGLLDWLTDGGGSLWGDGGGEGKSPFVGATSSYQGPGGAPDMGPPGMQPPPAPPPAPPQAMPPGLNGDFDQNGLMPPGGGKPPMAPPTADGPSLPPGMGPQPYPQGSDPMTAGMPPGLGQPPGVPLPTARPPGANPSPTPPPPLTPTDASAAVRSYEGAGGGGPVQIAGAGAPGQDTASTSGLRLPDMKGGGGLLGALGVDDATARRFTGSLGAGLTAAGNSAGKSPFQAFAGGAGAAAEGGEKAMKENHEQTHKYLNDAIKAQAAGDEVGYKTNYLKYLQAKLKADTDKAANGTAASRASNSPQQLYLSAIRATNSDPSLKGYNDAIRAARATGDQAAIAKAQAELEAKKTEIQQGHFQQMGIDPKTAQTLGQQPGFSEKNPVDAGQAGITSKNIGQKLQPGQFYRNPKDGQIYQFTGGPGGGKIPTKPTSPEPANPMKPERGTRAESSAADDEAA